MAITIRSSHNPSTSAKKFLEITRAEGRVMYRGTVPWFKVVHRNRDEFEVWHAQATPSDGWQEMGCCGTVDDCWDYIDAQGEETGLLFRIQDT